MDGDEMTPKAAHVPARLSLGSRSQIQQSDPQAAKPLLLAMAPALTSPRGTRQLLYCHTTLQLS